MALWLAVICAKLVSSAIVTRQKTMPSRQYGAATPFVMNVTITARVTAIQFLPNVQITRRQTARQMVMRFIRGNSVAGPGKRRVSAVRTRSKALLLVSRRHLVLAAGVSCLCYSAALLHADKFVAASVVGGRVVEADTGAPISGATVRIGPRTRGSRDQAVTTMGDGQFVFRDVSVGSHWLSATHPAYFGGGFGMRFPEDTQSRFDLVEGEIVTDVRLRFWRAGAISGRVLESVDDAAVGVSVVALRREIIQGQPRFTLNKTSWTDDRGEYRFFGLMPGDYLVAASAADPAARGQSPAAKSAEGVSAAFFGGTGKAAEATPIALATGEDRKDVNVVLRQRPVKSVSGRLVGLREGATVQLLEREAIDLVGDFGAQSVRVNGAGRFLFELVPEGNYLLRVLDFGLGSIERPVSRTVSVVDSRVGTASIPGRSLPTLPEQPSGKTRWLDLPMSVSEKNVELSDIQLLEGYEISGRMTFGDGPVPPSVAEILPSTSLLAMPLDGRSLRNFPLTGIRRDGSFRLTGLPVGAYQLVIQPAIPGWYMAMIGNASPGTGGVVVISTGSDTTVISMTAERSRLYGSVTNSASRMVETTSVLVFPTDEQSWSHPQLASFSETRPSRLGQYEFLGLPSGAYYLCAVSSNAPLSWRSPEVLRRLAPTAVRVQLRPGGNWRYDLIAVGGR